MPSRLVLWQLTKIRNRESRFFHSFQVKTERERHFFTSFAARDKTYAMLYKLWLNSMRIDQVGWVVLCVQGWAKKWFPVWENISGKLRQKW